MRRLVCKSAGALAAGFVAVALVPWVLMVAAIVGAEVVEDLCARLEVDW